MQTEMIKFSGGEIEATRGPDGEPYINLKKACLDMGLKYQPQLRKLQGKDWATIIKMVTVAADGRDREMTFLKSDAVPMWASGVNVNKVSEDLRPTVRAYQLEAAGVLSRHFGTGAIAVKNNTSIQRIKNVQNLMVKAIGELGETADDHESRLQKLEGRQNVTVVLGKKVESRERLLTRWIARFREETDAITRDMEQDETTKFFVGIHGSIKRVWGAKENWPIAKFYECARWLRQKYGIDITDIENPE